MTKLLYNQTLYKACEAQYEGGNIPDTNLIHTWGWYFEELQQKLNHDAIICMSMGDNGLEYRDGQYCIGRYFDYIYKFDQFNQHIKRLISTHNCLDGINEGMPCGVMFADNNNVQLLTQAENSPIPKTKLLYIKFNINTHPFRPIIYQTFHQKSWATVEQMEDPHIYFPKMKQHKFVLCPRGHGPDCYRTWEALYLGCIPIVPSQKIGGCHHHFRGKLPILEIDNWNSLNPAYLEDVWGTWSKQEWQWELLTEEYWVKYVQDLHIQLNK